MSKFITCTSCFKSKSLDDFYLCASCTDQRDPCCKQCKRAKAKSRYAENPEQKLASSKKRYEENKETRLPQIRQWQVANSEKRIIAAKLWEEQNKENRSQNKADWRKNNPLLVRLYASKRRAVIKNRGTFLVTPQEILNLLSKPCFYCGQKSEQIDHIVPIARGGRHSIGNLIQACAKCNQVKNKKFIMEWKKQGSYPCLKI